MNAALPVALVLIWWVLIDPLQTRFGLVGRPGQLALVREEPGSLALADEGQLALATGPSSVTTSPTSSPGR